MSQITDPMNDIIIRPAKKSDDVIKISELIVATEPNAYIHYFGKEVVQSISKLIPCETNEFSYRNITVCEINDKIVGIIVINTPDNPPKVNDFYKKLGLFNSIKIFFKFLNSSKVYADPNKNPVVHSLSLDSSYRGKGIAQLLFNYTFEKLKSNNYNVVYLDVWASNIAAIKFYNKYGFVQEKETYVSFKKEILKKLKYNL